MWDQRYRTAEFVYGTQPNDFLVSVIGSIPKGDVLCLAAGEGRNAVYLASQGCDVVAVDSSEVGLEKAQVLAGDREVSIETIVADLNEYEIENKKWDAITSIFCHLPSAQRPALYKKIIEGLKPGGVLVLESYTPDQLQFTSGGPPDRDKLVPLAELESAFKGFEFLHAEELERKVYEGKLHKGTGAVVQLVARK